MSRFCESEEANCAEVAYKKYKKKWLCDYHYRKARGFFNHLPVKNASYKIRYKDDHNQNNNR